ncbi:MAG: 3'-5' exonuclease [bacterium]|nr:3'-5' exonuclease [bacterium]
MSFASLITMNDNVLTAMDVETTGRNPYRHEVIQLAMVTLDCNLNAGPHFYTNIRPEYPDRMEPMAVSTHGITVESLQTYPDRHEMADHLWDWFQELNLAPGKRLIPLCHNSQFDIPFVQQCLGHDIYNEIFGYPTRDTQALIAGMMDKSAYNGTAIPFPGASLGRCCDVLGITLDDAHDALADALATAKVYQALLRRPSW